MFNKKDNSMNFPVIKQLELRVEIIPFFNITNHNIVHNNDFDHKL